MRGSRQGWCVAPEAFTSCFDVCAIAALGSENSPAARR